MLLSCRNDTANFADVRNVPALSIISSNQWTDFAMKVYLGGKSPIGDRTFVDPDDTQINITRQTCEKIAHRASYPMGTGPTLLVEKAPGA
jgi:hypothetical protein